MAALRPGRRYRRGFSLLEMLVAVTIIAILAGAATLSVSGNAGRRLRVEAERLQQVIDTAADEAVYRKMELGMAVTETSYAVLRYDAAATSWQPHEGRPFRVHALPGDLRLSLSEAGQKLRLLEMPGEARPVLLFHPSGETTAFVLSLASPSTREQVSLRADGIAPVVLDAADGNSGSR